jgi:hypothetical protein
MMGCILARRAVFIVMKPGKKVGAMLFWKFEVVSREAGALEVGAWRFEARQSFEPLWSSSLALSTASLQSSFDLRPV